MLYMDPVIINAFTNSFTMDPVSITAGGLLMTVLSVMVIVILSAMVTGFISMIQAGIKGPAFESINSEVPVNRLIVPKTVMKPVVFWEEPQIWWDSPEDISHGVSMSMKRIFHPSFK